jgi:glycine/D-amino acid oxidase-like deaminating enzyme
MRQGRLLMGGRGPFRDPARTSRFRPPGTLGGPAVPQLAGVEFDYRWSGRVAITRDFLPHVHEPLPG